MAQYTEIARLNGITSHHSPNYSTTRTAVNVNSPHDIPAQAEREVEVQLHPMRNLGARREWVVVNVLDTDY